MKAGKIISIVVAAMLVLSVSATACQLPQAQAAAGRAPAVALASNAAMQAAGQQLGASAELRHGEEGKSGKKKGGEDGDSRGYGERDRGNEAREYGRSDQDDAAKKFAGNNRKSAEVKGTITALSPNSFTIGNTTVMYDNNTRIEGTLAAGARVNVKLVRSNGSYFAVKIAVNGRGGERDDDEDDEDEDNDGEEVTPPVQLPAPTNLAAALSGTQINLTWADNANNETGFRLERATNSAFTANLTATLVSANATAHADATAAIGNTYFYRLFAYNAGGNSAASNTAVVTVVDPSVAVPQAPTNLAAVLSGTQVNLSWTDDSANETGFRLERATDAGFTQNLFTSSLAANITSYGDASATAGTTYYYRVFAYNAGGDSPASNTAAIATASINAAALYTSYCATCHGNNRSGLASGSLAQIINDINNGPGSMPAYSTILTPAQISALAQYLKTAP